MRSRNPTEWMWAEACQMLEQAERMHRRFFRLAASERAVAVWEPPVDVFEDERDVVIVIALPGVPAERVAITIEAGELIVRAERPLPFAGTRCAVRRLEIPYGHFERRIRLPEACREVEARELTDGCLILRLRKGDWANP